MPIATYTFMQLCVTDSRRRRDFCSALLLVVYLTTGVLALGAAAVGQESAPDWQTAVRQTCDAKDGASAMRILERQIGRAPQDTDVWAWRARVLTWSGNLAEAANKYVRMLKVSKKDPDIWMGFATVLLREGKTEEALHAANVAVELDPKRADLHVLRARVLRAAANGAEARREFEMGLSLDSTSAEARAGLNSLRGDPKYEVRFGLDNDLFNFAGANHNEWISLTSQWNPHWSTSFAGSFDQRGAVNAEKFAGSVTGSIPQ